MPARRMSLRLTVRVTAQRDRLPVPAGVTIRLAAGQIL
jgi:hypothetical protein